MLAFFVIFIALILLLAFMSSPIFHDDANGELFGLFALDRYEWYRSLRKDAAAAMAQLGRDWGRFCRFVERDVAWVVASVSGMIGLILTAIMMIGFIPSSIKTAVADTLNTSRSIAQIESTVGESLIETRTTLPDYVIAAHDPSVYMAVAYNQYRRRDEVPQVVPAVGTRDDDPNIDLVMEVKVLDELVGFVGRTVVGYEGPAPRAERLFDETIQGRSDGNFVTADVAGLRIEKTYPDLTLADPADVYEIYLENVTDDIIGRIRIEELVPEQIRIRNVVPLPEFTDADDRQVWVIDRFEPGEKQIIRVQFDPEDFESIHTKTNVIVRAGYAEGAATVAKEKEKQPDLRRRQPDRLVPTPRPLPRDPQREPEPERRRPQREQPEVIRSRRTPVPQKQEKSPRVGRLQMQVNGPDRVPVGEKFSWKFKLHNYGAETIKVLTVRILLDDRIDHRAGRELEFDMKNFKPGETRNATFVGKAARVGPTVSRVEILFGDKVVQRGTRRLQVIRSEK